MPRKIKHRDSAIHLNFILGDSAGGTFRVAFGQDDQLLIDHDVLSCGPTPRRGDLDAWRALRLRFWKDLLPGEFESSGGWSNDVLDGAPMLGGADRITLWAATGLSEQLFVASVCNLIAAENVPLDRVELVQFEYLSNRRARVIGMGELNEAQMGTAPIAVPLDQISFGNYLAAWDALTSPDPRSVECFAENNPSASAWTKDAMRLMLRRFPDVSSGLPHWDFRLLANVRDHGARALRVIGYTLTDGWDDGDLVGDYYLFGRLLRMAAADLPMPLIKITGDSSNMRATEVELTPFGMNILEGRASNFPANPIEDWAAGVRLSSSGGPLWFRDGNRLVSVSGPESAP